MIFILISLVFCRRKTYRSPIKTRELLRPDVMFYRDIDDNLKDHTSSVHFIKSLRKLVKTRRHSDILTMRYKDLIMRYLKEQQRMMSEKQEGLANFQYAMKRYFEEVAEVANPKIKQANMIGG